MKLIGLVGLVTLALASVSPGSSNVEVLSETETDQSWGGFPFQDCVHVGPCEFKTCSFQTTYGWYIKSTPNNAKECEGPTLTSCSNSLTTMCTYNYYADANCRIGIPESTTTQNEDVCAL